MLKLIEIMTTIFKHAYTFVFVIFFKLRSVHSLEIVS